MNRIKILQKLLKDKNIPAFLVTNIADIYYLTGFTGSAAFMIITEMTVKFFTDGRYTVQSAKEISADIERIIVPKYSVIFRDECPKYDKVMLQGSCDIATENIIKESGAEIIVDSKQLISRMRMIKDETEIEAVKAQYALAGAAFNDSLASFKSGVSEMQWAASLEYNMKIRGARGASFETIVASGIRSCLPHGAASGKTVVKGQPVIVDFGSIDKYASDYTRMFYTGADNEFLDILNILKDAVSFAIDGVKTGVKCSDIDKIARDYISQKGYGENFNHSLGHGVGIDVHELPVLNANSEDVIENGMVFTIEPGIYLSDKFGARLEETVHVKNGSAEIISNHIDKLVYEFE